MESRNRFRIILCISLAVHLLLFAIILFEWRKSIFIGTAGDSSSTTGEVVFVNIAERVAPVGDAEDSFLSSPRDKKDTVAAGPAGGTKKVQSSGTIGDQTAIEETILGQIRRQIFAKKFYPHLARREGVEGSPQITFQITPDGQPSFIKIQNSSGSPLLDKAATELIGEAAPYPFYKELITLEIRYSLTKTGN